jgi:arylsulfatase A-like enzyme
VALVSGLVVWRLDAAGLLGSRGKRPNIVLILTDDQRWDTLSVMPNVRRLLGGHGVTFQNSFVTTSMCCPSRSTILTGQYSRHTGVYQNTLPDGGARSFRDRSTVATWLHGGGYSTALVGKYLNDYGKLPGGYVPPGWDEWDAIAQNREIQFYGYDLNQNGTIVHYGRRPSDYSTTVLTSKAVSFLEGTRSPFLLYFAPIAPHEPSTPAPQDRGRYSGTAPARPPSYDEPDVADKPWGPEHPQLPATVRAGIDRIHQGMLESLRGVDRSVGQLVQALERRGLLDNTIVMFASDNGYLWGEHRLKGKVWPYEESIRVPLVIRTPWATGATSDRHLVTNADYASTFAELAGVEPGLAQDGRSLVPLLHGNTVSWPGSVLVEYLGLPGVNVYGPPPFEAVRTERYLYAEYRNGWRELYDLRTDPFELDNLAGLPGSPGIEAQLAQVLQGLLRA